jgi:hypothetical protein
MMKAAVHKAAENEIAADDVAAIESIAVNASVEDVRRGGKAPEVLGGEPLDVDAPSDLGMLHVRVSINVSLSLVSHTHAVCLAGKVSAVVVDEMLSPTTCTHHV